VKHPFEELEKTGFPCGTFSGLANAPALIACGHFVGGRWLGLGPEAGGGAPQVIESPFTGRPVAALSPATPELVDRAIRDAAHAQRAWGELPIKERTRVLFRFREELFRAKYRIVATKSYESGKTLGEAEAGLLKGVEVLEFALSLQNLDAGQRMEVSRGVFCESRRLPLGVVAGITPFNFPAMVPLWMIPIALALGNAFVWKPSEKVPMTSLLIAEALRAAGLPDGVFTVLQGGRETVEAILDHPEIRAVGFVGSTPVASEVYRRGTRALKRVLALGGAKNPIILLPDAEPEMAAQGIRDSFTGCAGQRCMAASVLLAVEDREGKTQRLIDRIVEKTREVVPGENMGAIISRQQLDFLKVAIGRAVAAGARPLVDGRAFVMSGERAGGFWLGPTILDGVDPGSEAAREELFGPVLSIVRCRDLSHALEIERSGRYGNATSVFTSSGALAEEVARRASSGMIGVNIGVPVPREPFSFGGMRDSKFGVGDITGESSLEFWSQLRKVTVKWSLQKESNWMS
jgi:malonate-semialdehyde dehydrogenase (acetylating)/methylmalonate-semialdehyde dehydrogenase